MDYVRGYGVPINVLFFEYLRDDREYLARSWLTDPEVEAPGGGTGKKQAPWNGRDFFVAVGENQHRNWDDMRRYGFVSAGHGDKYRKVMSNLFEGARVWAAIPGTGYVGLGEVIAQAVGVNDFEVELEGATVPILQARCKPATWARTPTILSTASTSPASAGSIRVRERKLSGRRACSPTRMS